VLIRPEPGPEPVPQGSGGGGRQSRAGERAHGGFGTLAGGRAMQGGQEPHELGGGAIRVDRVGHLEQGRPRHAPGDQEQGVGAAGDDLRQERNLRLAGERGQDADLAGQTLRGRTRPGEFHDELVTDGLAARVVQRILFAGRAGDRDRVLAQFRGHGLQCLTQRRSRALSQPFHLRHLIQRPGCRSRVQGAWRPVRLTRRGAHSSKGGWEDGQPSRSTCSRW